MRTSARRPRWPFRRRLVGVHDEFRPFDDGRGHGWERLVGACHIVPRHRVDGHADLGRLRQERWVPHGFHERRTQRSRPVGGNSGRFNDRAADLALAEDDIGDLLLGFGLQQTVKVDGVAKLRGVLTAKLD